MRVSPRGPASRIRASVGLRAPSLVGERELTAPTQSRYQAQRTRGSVWLCPWLAGAVTSGYLSPRTELQFPYLENKEINT